MAHYAWNQNTPQGAALRTLLNNLDAVLHSASLLNGLLNQMTPQQVMALFAFSDGINSPDVTTATNAKTELLSDLGKLLTDGSQTGVLSALNQLVAEFG